MSMREGGPVCGRVVRGLFGAMVWASASSWAAGKPASADWVPSGDGTEVVDVHARQAWARCVEGMQWDGKTCRGEPVLATHKEALALASARRKADGLDWRLPRVTDLRRLVNETGARRGLSQALFPAAPNDWYWAGTANVAAANGSANPYNYGTVMRGQDNTGLNRMAFLNGWAVDMASGDARDDMPKRTARLPVRLVRQQD